MSEVGSLIIKLRAETAQFREDMGKVKSDLKDFKDGAQSAGRGVGQSMDQSRESLILVGEEFGVHMPRALSIFVSKLPGVATAMTMAFPLIGAVAMLAIIGKLIENHEKLADAVRKAANESENSAIKYKDESRSLEIAGLRLDDEIAKLEHRPTSNKLKEAILESANALDKLAASFASEDQKMSDGLTKELGFWSKMTDYAEAAGEDILHGNLITSAVGVAVAWHTAEQAVVNASKKVEDARLALSNAPAEHNSTQVQDLVSALKAQEQAEIALENVTKGGTVEQLNAASAAARTAAEIRELTQQVSNNGTGFSSAQNLGL